MKRFLLLYGFIFALLTIANNTKEKIKEEKKIAVSNNLIKTGQSDKKAKITIINLHAHVAHHYFALNTSND